MNMRNYVRLKDAIVGFWKYSCGFDIDPGRAFTDEGKIVDRINIWYGDVYTDEIIDKRYLRDTGFSFPDYLGNLEVSVYPNERKIVKRIDLWDADSIAFDTDEELISYIRKLEECEIYEMWSDDFIKRFTERMYRDV